MQAKDLRRRRRAMRKGIVAFGQHGASPRRPPGGGAPAHMRGGGKGGAAGGAAGGAPGGAGGRGWGFILGASVVCSADPSSRHEIDSRPRRSEPRCVSGCETATLARL